MMETSASGADVMSLLTSCLLVR